jgi:hypothetical protein
MGGWTKIDQSGNERDQCGIKRRQQITFNHVLVVYKDYETFQVVLALIPAQMLEMWSSMNKFESQLAKYIRKTHPRHPDRVHESSLSSILAITLEIE